jgi:hypothetical protein
VISPPIAACSSRHPYAAITCRAMLGPISPMEALPPGMVARRDDEGDEFFYRRGMIAHLKGRLDSTGIDHAVIDVGGVGYLVGASARTLSAIGPVGEAAMLHTEMLVSEDSIRLVGFASADACRGWGRAWHWPSCPRWNPPT